MQHLCSNYFALGFQELYILYKIYPKKETFFSERILYLASIFNCSSQAQLHFSKFLCVLFH